MNGMAVITRNPYGLVLAQIPERQVFCFAVAGEAFGCLRLGILSPAEVKYVSAFFHMGRPGTMATFTPILVGRAIGDPLLGVIRFCITFVAIFMAAFADLHADHTLPSPDLCRRENCP
jgi:hypothetical protein